MRNVVLSLGISLDGYIARPGGEVDWLEMDPEYAPRMKEFFDSTDAAVMGRKTFDVALGMGGQGGFSGGTPNYVFSRTQPPGKRHGVEFVNQPLRPFVEALKGRPGKDIWLMGGGEIARDFLKEDLVDRIYLGIVPILLGEGIPLFPAGFPQRNLKLIEHRAYSKTGTLEVTYARADAKKPSRKRTHNA